MSTYSMKYEAAKHKEDRDDLARQEIIRLRAQRDSHLIKAAWCADRIKRQEKKLNPKDAIA